MWNRAQYASADNRENKTFLNKILFILKYFNVRLTKTCWPMRTFEVVGRRTDLKQDLLMSVFCSCTHLSVRVRLAFSTLELIHWHPVLKTKCTLMSE